MHQTHIPCLHCKPMSVWGTLVVKATHLIILDGDIYVYCCPYHADALLHNCPDVRTYEELDKKGSDI